MTVVVGVLVAVAVLAGAGPAGRRPHRRGLTPPGPAGRRWGLTPPQRWGLAPGRRGGGRQGAGAADGDLAGVLLAVAARLRAGATPQVAWAAVLGESWPPARAARAGGPDGVAEVVPDAAALLAAVGRGRGSGARPARRGGARRDGVRRDGVRRDGATASRVHAVVAGARTAAELGAPLADVLEQLAAAVAADAEQAGEVAAALAGPRATARVLVLLPMLGLLVGTALGARPWEVLTGGGPGAAAGVAGAVLVLAGRAWVGTLLRRARAGGGTA